MTLVQTGVWKGTYRNPYNVLTCTISCRVLTLVNPTLFPAHCKMESIYISRSQEVKRTSSRPGEVVHDSSHNEKLVCPICPPGTSKTYKKLKGLRIHRTKVHGRSAKTSARFGLTTVVISLIPPALLGSHPIPGDGDYGAHLFLLSLRPSSAHPATRGVLDLCFGVSIL